MTAAFVSFMKIYLIYGEQNVGKSTACRHLFSVMKGLDATVDFYERFEWGDFKAALTLNGVKTAIYSAGDEKHHLEDAIDFSAKRECEILVAVVRSRTHYNETLRDLTCGEDFFWFTLESGRDIEEMDANESRIVVNILKEIVKAI